MNRNLGDISHFNETVGTRTELPGDISDTQARYIEAAVSGVLNQVTDRLTALARLPVGSGT